MSIFGPEKIILTLQKYQYKPGELIKGSIGLNLKKPMRARKLSVSLLGKVKTTHRDSSGNMHTEDITIYDFTIPLDSENDYCNEMYSFEIKIQSDILETHSSSTKINQILQEKLGTIGGILGKMATMGQGPVRWMIHAQLDIPLKLDVRNSQDIVISNS
jgi:Arrestin (or S-antigen), N-terminal domain